MSIRCNSMSMTYRDCVSGCKKCQFFGVKQGEKEKFSDNPGHNILELYNVLVKVRSPKAKTEFHIQCKEHGIRVASQVTEPLETQLLRNWKYIRKISNLGGNSLVPSLSSKNNTMVIPFKIYAKADVKSFQFCPILLCFLNFFIIFYPGLSEQSHLCSYLLPVFSKLKYFDIYYRFNVFLQFLMKI